VRSPRYIVRPGYVVSAGDRQFHWIGASALVRLYQLCHGEYLIAEGERSTLLAQRQWPDAKVLRPRHDGRYGRPGESA
jgi:hypothetical protein